jgi:hypothetical protein
MKSNKVAVVLIAGTLAGFVVVLIWGMGIASAEDLSTWRYGSPGDVRRYGNQIMQESDYIVQGHNRNGYPVYVRNEAKAEYMDMMFRAGSPELYRHTQPQAPQTNINIYFHNSGETPQHIVAPQRQEAVSYRKPNYPAALVP